MRITESVLVSITHQVVTNLLWFKTNIAGHPVLGCGKGSVRQASQSI